MFLAIKTVEFDVWAGKRYITYFVQDDARFSLTGRTVKDILAFGVPSGKRRVFESTGQIRRSLKSVSRESILANVTFSNGWINYDMVTYGKSPRLGKFSNYEVVDLVGGVVYSLSDVISGTV